MWTEVDLLINHFELKSWQRVFSCSNMNGLQRYELDNLTQDNSNTKEKGRQVYPKV